MFITLYRHYQVSDLGEVRNKKTKRLLKQHLVNKGYMRVTFSLKERKTRVCFYVHRLVALAFLDRNENQTQVNHKNGIKTDNRLTNLEWATPGENNQHAYDIGLKKRPIGSNNPNYKHTPEFTKEVAEKLTSLKPKAVAEFYKISVNTVYHLKYKARAL